MHTILAAGGGSTTVTVPGIHLSEAAWLGVSIVVLALYLMRRVGMSFYHVLGPLVLGALSAGLWPSLGGKIADWGAAGETEKNVVYAILAVIVLGTIIATERAMRNRS